ncbi:branched-chain amino acid ABC transporter permease [Polynucleobacter sp. AP-Sanab-80-C2]|jgi:branched-chain amino acid transport system permease protein|uniref:branched-chain amino acid ABC transporter permease n=1 Tax=unclassified Polynucleobacter TaxID=2640945 RepID=UPI001BFCE795|nr:MULTISPECIES: branched-chain amino acid ABC transporter permease [unclassified Polynucleobacter]MEA9600460.1 branched-chain amino acid ABC transporter permease [Polynucleobacter sp. AP-Sanab-80-C2]QWE07181.1 branched-chain amino acid ABC transporter permease [Polynucleobacter sp. JS-JIR-5-A7]
MTAFIDIILSGLFHAAVLFLLAGGLQLVFGVQKIVNLACGAFYALGAYFGITLVSLAIKFGIPAYSLILVLIVAGLLMGLVGPIIERLLRLVYDREEGFQLLLTFAIMLLLEDLIRMIWGATPMTLGNLSMTYGQLNFASTSIPTYKILVIGASIILALGLGWMLQKTDFGRIVRATAENRRMSEAMGVNVVWINVAIFTMGTILGTIGGALVVPTAAASLEMISEVVVEAFAVVVIGGLGSMRGALVGALIVGIMRAFAVSIYAEIDLLLIYLIVIAILIFKPAGLFGKAVES